MDAATVVVGVLISVLVCAVLGVAVKLSFREREFEEVFGRQEHASFALPTKKAPKKKKAKSKGSAPADTTTDDEGKGVSCGDRDRSDDVLEPSGDRHPHVEYDPDPVIIDEPKPASKAKPENIPKKSILRNRSDSDVAVPTETEERPQQSSFSRIPKDEIELKHHPELKSRHSAKAAPPASNDDREVSSAAPLSAGLVQEEVIETAQRVVAYEAVQQPPRYEDGAPTSAAAAAAAATAETRPQVPATAETTKKTKAKPTAVATATAVAAVGAGSRQSTATPRRVEDVNSIAAAVQRASLSKADVQLLIDALLGKDESSPSWTTKVQKGDPVVQLTKQLEDKDRQLLDERQQAAAAASQLSRLSKDLQEERTRRAQGEQQASERTAALNGEVAALRQRMQHSHEQHVRELAALRQQSADAQEAAVSRLSQENQQLKQAMPLPSEMKALREQAQIVKNELAKSIQSLASAEQKCRHLEEQISAKDLILVKQLEDLKQQAVQIKAVTSEAERATSQALQAKQDAEMRASQLHNDLHQTMASMDLTFKEKDKEIQMLKQQLNVMDGKHRQLQSNNQANAELEDHKARLLQSQAEVGRLQAELDEVRLQAASLKETVAQHKAANGADAQQQQQQHDAATTLDACEAEAVLQANRRLEQQLAQLTEQQHQSEARLQVELSEAKRRNDELRRKNWVLAEAVESAEQLASQTPELRRQLDSASAARDVLTSRVKRLEERNAELLESQQKQSLAAAAAAAAASTDAELLRGQLKQLHERERRLKSDLDKSNQQLSQLTSEAARHRSSAASLETQVSAELSKLQQQLRSREFEIDSLQADLEVQRQTADAFKVKYDKADKVDHSNSISAAATTDVLQQLKAYQEELARLKEQLSAQAVSTAPLEQVKKSGGRPAEPGRDSSLAAEADLHLQLEAQKAKNNELRERNWKLVEALNEAQKHRGPSVNAATAAATISTTATDAAAPTDAGFSQVKQTLSRLYPAVHLNANLSNSAWLAQFEAAVRDHDRKDLAVSESHKRLLVQTDRALASLQSRLEAEERKWQQTVAEKDSELLQLRHQLQNVAKAGV